MTIHLLPVTPRTPQAVRHALIASCAEVKHEIASVTSLPEAYALYNALRDLEREMQHLVNLAADKCEQILERL